MGLDQYVWASEKRPTTDVDFDLGDYTTDLNHPDCWEVDENGETDKIFGNLLKCKTGHKAVAYFRKHPDLHGAIDQIYRRKGGTKLHWDSFHGNVVLDLEDIEALEKAFLAKELPHTTGFFFGETGEWHTKPTLEFIKRAKEEIARGWTVWYDSSW
jgi:hypothetical protein